MSLWTIILIGVVLAIIVQLAKALFAATRKPEEPAKLHIGDLTLDALRFYNGYDFMRPLLIAVKGKVYDVTNSYDLYAPGGCVTPQLQAWRPPCQPAHPSCRGSLKWLKHMQHACAAVSCHHGQLVTCRPVGSSRLGSTAPPCHAAIHPCREGVPRVCWQGVCPCAGTGLAQGRRHVR